MSYNIVIPNAVLVHPELSASAKIMYGEVLVLAAKKGYCFANNEYFAERFSMKRAKTASDWISELERAGFIRIEYSYSGSTISERRIFALVGIEKSGASRGEKTPRRLAEKRHGQGGKTPTTVAEKRPDNIDKVNIKKNNSSSGLQSSPTPPPLFFLDFQAIISEYCKELGTLGTHKPEELYSILIENVGAEIVKENASGVSEDSAARVRAALNQIKAMAALHESEKSDFVSNGKKWFKKSLKRLISTQAYARLPAAVESSPEPPKTASNDTPQDWKIQFCADLAKKGLNSSMTPEKIKPILTGVGLAFGRYIPIADKDGMRCAVAAFLSSKPELDYSGAGYEGENRVKYAFLAWVKTDAGRAFGAWAVQRNAANSMVNTTN